MILECSFPLSPAILSGTHSALGRAGNEPRQGLNLLPQTLCLNKLAAVSKHSHCQIPDIRELSLLVTFDIEFLHNCD